MSNISHDNQRCIKKVFKIKEGKDKVDQSSFVLEYLIIASQKILLEKESKILIVFSKQNVTFINIIFKFSIIIAYIST